MATTSQRILLSVVRRVLQLLASSMTSAPRHVRPPLNAISALTASVSSGNKCNRRRVRTGCLIRGKPRNVKAQEHIVHHVRSARVRLSELCRSSLPNIDWLASGVCASKTVTCSRQSAGRHGCASIPGVQPRRLDLERDPAEVGEMTLGDHLRDTDMDS